MEGNVAVRDSLWVIDACALSDTDTRRVTDEETVVCESVKLGDTVRRVKDTESLVLEELVNVALNI